MKYLLAALIAVCFLAEAWSLTCYRCGGASPDCPNGNATVTCGSSDLPDEVYGCRVYTVNYTTLNSVKTIKGCCLYEDCEKNPCEGSAATSVCTKWASCQSDKCNYDHDKAKASPRPTLGSSGIVFSSAAGLVMTFAGLVMSI